MVQKLSSPVRESELASLLSSSLLNFDDEIHGAKFIALPTASTHWEAECGPSLLEGILSCKVSVFDLSLYVHRGMEVSSSETLKQEFFCDNHFFPFRLIHYFKRCLMMISGCSLML